MLIKNVKVLKKNVVITWNDGKESSILVNTYLDLILYKGQDVSVSKVLKRDAYFIALDEAMKMCRRKDYSELKLKQNLLKNHDEKIVKDVIKRLKELQMINDDLNAHKIINKCLNKNMGVLKIKHELEYNGYDEHYIDSVVKEESNDRIEKAAQKYIKTHSRYEPKKLKQNLYRYLMYQGFDSETIYNFISNYDGGNIND